MPPLEKEETFATGMVKPKTTALFFDKLWVHPALIKGFCSDELEEYRVPPEVCMTEPIGDGVYYESALTQAVYSNWDRIGDVREALRLLGEETSDLQAIFAVESMKHFGIFTSPDDPQWRQVLDSLDLPSEYLDSWGFSTEKRNSALIHLVRLYAQPQRKIHLTPIYLNPSHFDKEPIRESRGVEVCLDSVPTVVDSELTWEQVLEFRKDKDSQKKIDRLRRWFSRELSTKSEMEIKATLAKRLEDYEQALHVHGIKTILGGFTSLCAAGPAILNLSTVSPLAAILGGLGIGAASTAWIAIKRVEKSALRRREVAYIYDVGKLPRQHGRR